MNNMRFNFAAFAALADANITAELREHGVDDLVDNDPELAAAIKAIEIENKAKAIRDAAEGIVALKGITNAQIVVLVEQLREVRRQERDILAKIAAVNKAKEFGAATRNYMPLLSLLTNGCIPHEYRELAAKINELPEKQGDKNVSPEPTQKRVRRVSAIPAK